jgi:hypothetical protein
MDAALGTIVEAKRAALEGAETLRAQAAPQLAIIDGINAEISSLAEKVQVTQDAIAVLSPYRSLPEVAPFVAVLEASIPLYAALSAAAGARLILAGLVVPDPITVALAASSVAADGVSAALEVAFARLMTLEDAL